MFCGLMDFFDVLFCFYVKSSSPYLFQLTVFFFILPVKKSINLMISEQCLKSEILT